MATIDDLTREDLITYMRQFAAAAGHRRTVTYVGYRSGSDEDAPVPVVIVIDDPEVTRHSDNPAYVGRLSRNEVNRRSGEDLLEAFPDRFIRINAPKDDT